MTDPQEIQTDFHTVLKEAAQSAHIVRLVPFLCSGGGIENLITEAEGK